jgi:hypothetical protein
MDVLADEARKIIVLRAEQELNRLKPSLGEHQGKQTALPVLSLIESR